jgi:hypothetical protein
VKALSLWQPWASLIAPPARADDDRPVVGGKRVETRGWPAPRWLIGERIAIHASKRESELWLCLTDPFSVYVPEPEDLPRGYLIAHARLDRCSEMTEEAIARLEVEQPHEYAFGLYEPGRFAWVLRDVRRLVDPIPYRGRQKLFDVPDELTDRPSVPVGVAHDLRSRQETS